MTPRQLLDELAYYASQLEAVGHALVELLRGSRRHAEFISQVAETYQVLALDLADVYHALKRALRNGRHGLGSPARKTPIEILESTFVILRDAAEEARSRATKLAHLRSRESRILRETADRLEDLAANAAKLLVAEANEIGRWTVEWERALGLRPWLR